MPSLGLGHSCCPGSSMAGPAPFWLHLWLSWPPAVSMSAVFAYISMLSVHNPIVLLFVVSL